MTSQAFDDNGNEIFFITANVICPTEFYTEAAAISSNYMKTVEKVIDWQQELMLPTKLNSLGVGLPTHHLCSRSCYTNEAKGMADEISSHSAQHAWCHTDSIYPENSSAEIILTRFCVVICSLEQLLEITGLKQIG